ncbi:GNAT family N-acetyltransferase [Paenibacillus nasutitermitis]|uniref:N-acetyltransferase domain-containing protein n=1 Tax=Paenibacillus nasutitermitis TaxID=1652958 RepID=A0A917DX71_9BACL|nr:GNAT family N-acetyltransferase [Paenibacillus nasutitermitis]GGD78642.1 hypothetical protein GCM10010911_40890 [Paenibacillus nasutitermitis]
MESKERNSKKLLIRNISRDEIGQVAMILEEAALWLKSIGQEMWEDHQYSIAGILSCYNIGQLYLGCLEDRAVAAMILQEEDPFMWPDTGRTDSLFLHKLAVMSAYRKNGFAVEMLDWAKDLARLRGRRYVRLDCASDRPKLCGFYENNGFVRVREQLIMNRFPTAFYEYEIGDHK